MTLKAKLKLKKPVFGTWLTIPHPTVAEVISQQKLDFVVLDLEHSPMTYEQALGLIPIFERAEISVLIRVAKNDEVFIKKAMDLGVQGLIVPMINSVDDVNKMVDFAHYPPKGKRGVGLTRAHRFGDSFESYVRWLQKDAVIIAQVEHKDAVSVLAKIVNHPDVDAFMVGPYDLSASLGVPGQFEHPLYQEALNTIKKVMAKSKAAPGVHIVHPDKALVAKRIAEGYRFVAYGTDAVFLNRAYVQNLSSISTK